MEHQKNPNGRPTIYSDELAAELMDMMANTHLTNAEICESRDYFPSTQCMYRWRTENPKFKEMYDRAKTTQVEARIENFIKETYSKDEDLYEASPGRLSTNNAASNRLRVRATLLMWHASRYDRQRYGDKNIEDKIDNVREEVHSMISNVEKSRDKL